MEFSRAFAAVCLMCSACGRSDRTQSPAAAVKQCLQTHDKASASSAAVFAKRHLQGGGPTWAAVLGVVVRRHATVVDGRTRPAPDGVGAVFDATYQGAATWYALDEEGDGAMFCTDHPALFRDVAAGFDQLNRDAVALSKALDEAPAGDLE